jgi:DinB superfamily
MDKSLIEKFADGGAQLKAAYQGLTLEQLFAYPIPNTWSLHQIAVHMMDSDLIGCDRMKRIACMDKPLLVGYDETAFSQLPGSNDIDTYEAIDIFARNRRMFAIILRHLPDAAFERVGIHTEKGKVTLEEMVQSYIQHLNGHLEWIAKKRKLL